MDGLIRWFHRLSPSSSSPDHHVNDDGYQAQAEQEVEEELTITVDLDLSGLKPIKVPIRTNHKLASMDHHKVSHRLKLEIIFILFSPCF